MVSLGNLPLYCRWVGGWSAGGGKVQPGCDYWSMAWVVVVHVTTMGWWKINIFTTSGRAITLHVVHALLTVCLNLLGFYGEIHHDLLC